MAAKKHKLVQTSDQLVSRMIVNLFGPRKAGKTWCAFSLCKKWPKNPAENKRKLVLDDVIYWQWDPDGMIGLAPHKLGVKYVFNMPALIAEYGFPKALSLVCKEADDIAYDDENVSVEIHDTVTTFDSYSLGYLESLPHPNPRAAESGTMLVDDIRALFGRHLAFHRQYQTETVMRPERVSSIYLFHEKSLDIEGQLKDPKASKAAKAKARQKVQDQVTTINIVPETTGSGDKYYANACSLELSMTATPIAGKPNAFKRQLHPIVHDGRRSLNRFQTLFTGPMEPDLKKVRSAILAATK